MKSKHILDDQVTHHIPGTDGTTALHWACHFRTFRIATRHLIFLGLEIMMCDDFGCFLP